MTTKDAPNLYAAVDARRHEMTLKGRQLRSPANLELARNTDFSVLDTLEYSKRLFPTLDNAFSMVPVALNHANACKLAPLVFVEGPERFGVSTALVERFLLIDPTPEYDPDRYK
jgi:hypothetical protein